MDHHTTRLGPLPVTAVMVRRALWAALVVVALLLLSGCGAGRPHTRLVVVARGLANPRQMSFGPDGALYVAEAGSGGQERCAKDPGGAGSICLGHSGAVARLDHGRRRRVISGLPSVAAPSGQQASGPADAIVSDGRLVLVTQDTQINRRGGNQFGALGRLLGHVLSAPVNGGKLKVGADLGAFEAARNPDRGAGAPAGQGIDSDPYAIAPYRGGYVVADAAGNDLLWIRAGGAVRVLAVFPLQYETAPAGVVARTPQRVAVQSVPTSVAVGPDGTLYVSELSGFPFDRGYARVWRLRPGQRPEVYANGFTNVSSLAFDHQGRLLVLEINKAGLRDARASGQLIRVEGSGRRTALVTDGLPSATGVAVSPGGAIFVAVDGTDPATGSGPPGQVVRVVAG